MHSSGLGLFTSCVMKLVRFAVASLSALLIAGEGKAEPCNDPRGLSASQPEAMATCETVVVKRSAMPETASAAEKTSFLATPPPSPSSLLPDWVYAGSGIVDAHIGERQIFVNGRPTNRYTGVTLITPFEQSQYNPYPVGPEIGVGWKTPSLAAYGVTDISIGFTAFRSSLYTTATILGVRAGHDLADGVNAELIVGPIFTGYSEHIAVAAELEFDLKEIAAGQRWEIAEIIPGGLMVKNRLMPGKAEFWTPGQGVNAAFEVWAGFKFPLQ